jgi:hypothetical protein
MIMCSRRLCRSDDGCTVRCRHEYHRAPSGDYTRHHIPTCRCGCRLRVHIAGHQQLCRHFVGCVRVCDRARAYNTGSKLTSGQYVQLNTQMTISGVTYQCEPITGGACYLVDVTAGRILHAYRHHICPMTYSRCTTLQHQPYTPIQLWGHRRIVSSEWLVCEWYLVVGAVASAHSGRIEFTINALLSVRIHDWRTQCSGMAVVR